MNGARRLYFDHNASAPVRPAAADAVARALQMPGNPSSVHGEGRAARGLLEIARRQVAEATGGQSRDVVFTSGATEALNALLRPELQPATGPERLSRLLIGATEHAAVRDGHSFAADATQTVPIDENGVIVISALEKALAALRGDGAFAPALVAIQLANNETGAIQPLADIARVVEAAGAVLVVDAVQAIGKIPFDLAASGASAIAISGHKFGGPKGAGAIIFNGERIRFGRALIAGGGQELRRRSGTENLPGIAGMAAAISDAAKEQSAFAVRSLVWRTRIEAHVLAIAGDAIIFARDAARLPNTTLFSIPGLKAETLLMALDLAGIALSSGAACSSGKVGRSHVLDAMGVTPDLADGAIRVSTGWNTTDLDVSDFCERLQNALTPILQRRNQRAA